MMAKKISLAGIYFFSFLSLLSGCSLPRFIILNDPLTPQEHLTLGLSYEKAGEFDAALKEYQQAAPHLPAAHLYMGNLYFTRGEIAFAEEHYLQALEEDPDNADACNNLAWLYFSSGKNLAEAYRLVRRALQLNPSKSEIYLDTLEQIKEKLSSQKESPHH